MAELSSSNIIVARLVQIIDNDGELDAQVLREELTEQGYLLDGSLTSKGLQALELAAALDADRYGED